MNAERRKYHVENNDYLTIEPHAELGVAVYGHGTYPRSSVLAGQERYSFITSYDSVEEAVAEWPEAEVMEWSTKPPAPSLGPTPPDWFDPGYAGEEW